MKYTISVASAILAASFPVCATTAAFSGGLHFSGDVTLTTVGGNGLLTFDHVSGQTYTFTIDSASGGLTGFAGGGSESNIGAAIAPINIPLNIPNFLTFQNSPDTFTLTFVYTGVDSPGGCSANPTNYMVGNLCSPPGTPFNLEDLLGAGGGQNSSVSFVVGGFLVDGGNTYPAIITFTAADTGMSYEQILRDQTSGVADVFTYGAQLQTSTSAPPPGCGDSPYQVRYAGNLNVGESYINITNTGANGAPALGPGFGTTAGNICVNVYAFDPGEELIACCSCLVTPGQTANLGAVRDLTSKTETGTVPTSITIKLLATLAGAGGTGTTCTNSAASVINAAPVCGMAAWGTTLHSAPGGGYSTTETPFGSSTLSPGELTSVGNRCAAIIGNSSGFGICGSCRAGALGADKL